MSQASSLFLVIVIRRSLYAPVSGVVWLNSSYVWRLSLQLAEYNSQHGAETREATGLKSLPTRTQKIGRNCWRRRVEKKIKIRGGGKGHVTTTVEKVEALIDNFELSAANQVKTYRIVLTEILDIRGALDDESLT